MEKKTSEEILSDLIINDTYEMCNKVWVSQPDLLHRIEREMFLADAIARVGGERYAYQYLSRFLNHMIEFLEDRQNKWIEHVIDDEQKILKTWIGK